MVDSAPSLTEAAMLESCVILKFQSRPYRRLGRDSRRFTMGSDSPADALGLHAQGVRDAVVEAVRSVHYRFAEAHAVSRSRYGMGFGSQWRDLLDEAHDTITRHGFQSHTLTPGGHKLPVVNGCLVYVWRAPDDREAVSKFASSPTRQSGFAAPPPPAMLFDPTFSDEAEADEDVVGVAETEVMLEAVRDGMPLVLVMVWSTPRQLQAIEWAVAELDEAGKVTLHGQESIWEPEGVSVDAASNVESFSEGEPIEPVVEPRKQEGIDPYAR
ncbi:hypothetical protein [Agrococcus lahaulensis]|uniref:hypothetical protein n=1 Tax=Agrococcus lahaulensis TaxID=341722 RepID=UPI001B7FD1CB|nr:hypothetical protein [Agrococcus lahaulensis]